MEGLEISVLNLSEVLNDNKTQRIDSEYFKKEYLKIDRNIENKKYLLLSALSEKITDFGAFSQNNFIKYKEKGSYYFIRNQDIENLFIKDKKIFIDKDVYEKLSLKLNEFDLLIQRTGSIGKCGLVLKKDLPSSANQNLAQVKPDKNKINPYFLNTFLNSSIGQKTFERLATGNVQPWLNLGQIESIKIPLLSEKLQILIADVVKSSYSNITTSKQSYTKAETLLLEEIGLQDFTPSKEPVNIKSFKDSFGTSGRLDAEYYQKKYDVIENTFDKFKRIKLIDLVNYPVSSGITPKAGGNAYTDFENGIPFIRAVDLKGGEVITLNFKYIKHDIHNGVLKRTQLKKGDVLLSIAGTVGRSSIFSHNFEANINQAVSILRFEEDKIKRLYLVAFFNSFIGKEFVSKFARQGVQTNLSLAEIGNLSIPIIDYSKQQQIANLIEESFALKKQSKYLLEVAKRAVEVAIEKNEEVALKYIKENE